MKTTELVKDKIKVMPVGRIFTVSDLSSELTQKEAVIKCLNRLVRSGQLGKLSKGKFFKPEMTVFGALRPSQDEILKDLLESNGKPIGYLTGYSIYNRLGFTTQVSNTVQIARNDNRQVTKRGIYKICITKQKNKVTKENISILQLLDVIKTIKLIPDSGIDSSCRRLISLFSALKAEETQLVPKLALNYPPSTRALTGALLEKTGNEKYTQELKKSLNPITVYKLGIQDKVLSTVKNWNIQ